MEDIMKLKRSVSLLLVAVMLCSVLALTGCGKVHSTVKVVFINDVQKQLDIEEQKELSKKTDGTQTTKALTDDDYIVGQATVTVEGTEQNPPTVLKAAEAALIYLEFENGYELTNDGYSVKAVNGIVEVDETDATTGYYSYWKATVDGQESTSGRQSETIVYDGQTVEFRFVSDSRPREDVKSNATTEDVD